jgi:hypothetical protein
MYTVSGTAITAATYNTTTAVSKLLEYDGSKGWVWGLIGTNLAQIYASGSSVTASYSVATASTFSIANSQYFISHNGLLKKITTISTTPGSAVGTTDVAAVTKYTDLAVAYATEYHYPGVAGTPVIYRVGDYGVGAYSNSVSLKGTYSTA